MNQQGVLGSEGSVGGWGEETYECFVFGEFVACLGYWRGFLGELVWIEWLSDIRGQVTLVLQISNGYLRECCGVSRCDYE